MPKISNIPVSYTHLDVYKRQADELAPQVAAYATAHDRENSFPHDSFAALHAAGYLALTVPQEYGGQGATPLELALAQERLCLLYTSYFL